MNSENKIIALVQNYCTHYTVRTYELLAQSLNIDFYFYAKGRSSQWHDNTAACVGYFNYKYLSGFSIFGRRVTPSLLPRLWCGKYEVIIQGIGPPFPLLSSYLISRLRGRPFILWTGVWMRLSSRSHRLIFPVVRHIYRHADAIVVYGEHVKRYLITEGTGANKIFVAPHAVDNSRYNQNVSEEDLRALRIDLQINEEQKIILYLGRLEPFKGIEYLIEAFASLKHKDAILVIAGKGSDRENLEKLVTEKGIGNFVRFPGYIPYDQTAIMYAQAWVYVLPSVTTAVFKEPWGLVVNEAFNQGVPVVATNAVGAAAGGLVQDGVNGFIVPERDSQALARAIACLLDDAKLHRQMSKQAKELISGWTQERMAEGIMQAIKFVYEREKEM